MKKHAALLIILVLGCCLPPVQPTVAEPSGDTDLSQLLAEIGPIGTWKPEGEPESAEGEDLFLLINGGAEIYHEYGFVRAVYQTYTTAGGRSINLELYEMEDNGAAYGIFTFKTNSDGTLVDVGEEAWLETYYLNVWRGNYLITVVDQDADASDRTDLVAIARAVASRLPPTSQKPGLVGLLPDAQDITYLRGNLALFNRYQFHSEDIFRLREGITGIYKDHSRFIFHYESETEARQAFEHACATLRAHERFSDFESSTGTFTCSDREKQRIAAFVAGNRIAITVGDPGAGPAAAEQLRSTLLNHTNKKRESHKEE